MEIGLLLIPHANIRYRESMIKITIEELRLVLRSMNKSDDVYLEQISNASFLFFKTESLQEREIRNLYEISGIYLLFKRINNALIPLVNRWNRYLEADLPLLLKYKGKTNEVFTDSLITMAVASSEFSSVYDSQLVVCDPMAGKCTTLMQAARRGYHSVGIEINKSYVDEVKNYLNRYFEYHHKKYKQNICSLTDRGKESGKDYKWIFSDSIEHYREGDTRSIRVIHGDTRNINAFLKNSSIHIMVTDVPYNVQTSVAHNDSLYDTLEIALPCWKKVIKNGGVLCMSFNQNTLKRKSLLELIERSGFKKIEISNISHWVEQAIQRDVILAKA